ncbi:MAG: Aminodeoxychorismate lyase [Parcubacteria group bacterium GW2011_GWA2_38_13]|nr:MAG: Aminodeoxychorismate lyase [Parcubacteria group bacterium GW2011_GWA2_38_13]
MRKIVILIIILLILAFGAYWYYLRAINEKNSNALESMKFVVQKGEGSEEISIKLEEAGLIQSNFLFDIYAWQSGYDNKLQAGEYEMPKNLSIKEVIRILSSIKAREQNKITIIEGWKIQDMARYFEENAIAQKDDFIKSVSVKSSWWNDFTILDDKPKDQDLEGYLFPDTYLIYKDALIDDIINKMLLNLEKKFTDEMREDAKKTGYSIHEILTLASIIEKEVSSDEDRAMVSDIFNKRLKLGIGLQSDATVNYVTGKGELQPSYDDVAVDNPYNTYKYRGLPPGPICSPSLSSIRAAIYPKSNDYLFFLTTPDGKIILSKTYEEHIIAKRKYLK